MGEVPSLLMNSKSEFGSSNTIPRITISTEIPEVVEPPPGFTLNPADHLTGSRPPKRSRLGASQPLSIDDQVTSEGTWTSNSMLDLQKAVETFLEAVDEIVDNE